MSTDKNIIVKRGKMSIIPTEDELGIYRGKKLIAKLNQEDAMDLMHIFFEFVTIISAKK